MQASDEGTGVELTGPGGTSAKFYGKRTSDLISIMTMVLVMLLCWVVWQHLEDSKRVMTALVESSKDGVQAQREMTCVISLPQDKREQEFMSPHSLCKRLTR